MKFSDLANYLEKLEKTSSRNEITQILADLFRKTDIHDIEEVIYLLLGQLAPKYKGIVFNLAERMMQQVLAKAYDKSLDFIKGEYKRMGDVGSVAESLSAKRTSNLSVREVYDNLQAIATDEGEGTQERKIDSLANLLKDLDAKSARYVARIPVGRLRLGFSDKTILDSLSWMTKGNKSAKGELERAYQVLPDVGLLAKRVKIEGLEAATNNPKPAVGVPILPMLAQRLKDPIQMVEKMGKVAIEPKLDGLRIQIHFKKGKTGFVMAFTRNMNETSWMFPELSQAGRYINATQAIIDTEAIGLDEATKALADFQSTMTRRRKYEIAEHAKKIAIKFYCFDILFKDDVNLMHLSYLERRKVLEKTIKKGNLFEIVDNVLTDSPDDIRKLNQIKRSEGLEGIMIKKVESAYIPGRTGWRWVKMKEDEKSFGKIADTVDVVIMGYSAGRGKRADFGLGQFLCGVVDGDYIKTTTKIGTGLKDLQFRELNKRFTSLVVSKMPKEYVVHKDYYPDFWVSPEVVVEIAGDEITKSPKHTSGLAVRFPRLVKFRDDKDKNQATTVDELVKLYKLQYGKG